MIIWNRSKAPARRRHDGEGWDAAVADMLDVGAGNVKAGRCDERRHVGTRVDFPILLILACQCASAARSLTALSCTCEVPPRRVGRGRRELHVAYVRAECDLPAVSKPGNAKALGAEAARDVGRTLLARTDVWAGFACSAGVAVVAGRARATIGPDRARSRIRVCGAALARSVRVHVGARDTFTLGNPDGTNE